MKRLTIGGQACVDILSLLVTMAWADERLDDKEKAGVRGAAQVLNLTRELRDQLDLALKEPVPLERISFEKLSARDRAFAYACAAWMAGADDDADEKEEALLDELATKLGLDAVKKAELERLVVENGPTSTGARNWSEEIMTLFRAVLPRVAAADPVAPAASHEAIDDVEIEVSFDA